MTLLRLAKKTEVSNQDEVAVSAMDRRVEAPWISALQIKIAAVAMLFVAATAYGFVRYGLHRTLTMDAERIVISTVQPGAFHDYIPITGNVEPRDTVFLDAIDGGQVVELLVDEGANVSAGQPLVRLNNSNLQLQVINSEAQLSEQLNRAASTKLAFEQSRLGHTRDMIDMQFQVEQSRQRLARMQSLAATGAIKRSDIEDAQLDLNRLTDLLAAAKQAKQVDESLQREQMQQLDKTIAGLNKNLAIARQNLDNLVIKAPITGQLTSLEAHLGESKRPGQRIGQIDQVDSYKVSALIDEHYLARIAAGQEATAEIDSQTHTMQLTKLYSEVRDRQFKVDLAFMDTIPKSVRRGQSLQLRLGIGASSQGLIVANGPFYEDTGGQWAFVVHNTEATRRPIKLGRRNPESVEVLEGLSNGDRLITSSYESLKDFSRIDLRGIKQ